MPIESLQCPKCGSSLEVESTGKAPSAEQFEAARKEFYQLIGWGATATAPTRAKLEDPGVGWVADLLEQA